VTNKKFAIAIDGQVRTYLDTFASAEETARKLSAPNEDITIEEYEGEGRVVPLVFYDFDPRSRSWHRRPEPY
jgi:hypothetical protein